MSLIFENGKLFNSSNLSSSKSWLPKLILLGLVIIVLVELFWGYQKLTGNISSATPTSKSAFQPIQGGKIMLMTDKKDFKVGETIPVIVKVSTGGWTTDGTDVVLSYDTTKLEAQQATAFSAGTIYDEYPPVAVDQKNGFIQVSGISSIASSKKGFNGIGILGTINFKAKAPGKVSLKVNYKEGATNESNIVESQSSKDVLSGVTDMDLNIN